MNSSTSLNSLKPNILPLTALLVVGTTLPLIMMPWFNDVTSQWKKVGTQTELRNKLEVKADRLEKFAASEADASKALLQNTVEPAIPATADPSGVLGTLEQVAQSVGVRIEGVTYANAAAGSGQSASPTPGELVKVSFSVEGVYENVVSFISRAETVSRVVSLSSLQISKNDADSQDVIASFEVSAPYLAHPTDLGPIEEAFPELTASATQVIDRLEAFQKASYAPTDAASITGKTNPF